ncbi:type II toxin-antitoxin system VapC family toxin [Blastomonas sp.]|uniref:type II toxin-antitoxin system VapC family toxin n=1 Tax=Blastomonas sp. TaxID=1909299 RepID=UPI003593219C
MKLCVVDASVIGPLIIPDEAEELLASLMPVMVEGRAIVPQHWRLEVLNLGRTAIRRERLDAVRFAETIAVLSRFRIKIDDATNAHAWGRSLDIAERHGLTAYDAAYVELARRIGAPLMTRDKALASAAQSENLEIVFT